MADLEEDEEAEENQLSYEAEAGNQDESAMQKAASLGDHNPIPMDQGMLLIYRGRVSAWLNPCIKIQLDCKLVMSNSFLFRK